MAFSMPISPLWSFAGNLARVAYDDKSVRVHRPYDILGFVHLRPPHRAEENFPLLAPVASPGTQFRHSSRNLRHDPPSDLFVFRRNNKHHFTGSRIGAVKHSVDEPGGDKDIDDGVQGAFIVPVYKGGNHYHHQVYQQNKFTQGKVPEISADEVGHRWCRPA